MVEVYLIPQPSRGSGLGERRKLPRGGVWGGAPAENGVLDVLCAILCHFSRVLVHFGRWLSGIIKPKIQENITGIGKVTLHACIL